VSVGADRARLQRLPCGGEQGSVDVLEDPRKVGGRDGDDLDTKQAGP
jgi:hypothetical protein